MSLCRHPLPRIHATCPCKFASDQSKDFELDLSIALLPGITILFGPSGAGKTTLLDCIAGLTRPDAGRIAIARTRLLRQRGRNQRPARRRKVGYVFRTWRCFRI